MGDSGWKQALKKLVNFPTEETPAQGVPVSFRRRGSSSSSVLGWCAPAFVWAVWGLLLLTSLYFIRTYGRNIPNGDDWINLVPYVSGEQPVTFDYLWEQEFEHRYLLPKVILISTIRLTGDFRAPAVFTAFTNAGLALAMIFAAKSLRGRTSFADAFFPLALLQDGFHPSFPINFAWIFVYILPALVANLALLVIIRKGTRLTLGSGLLAGLALALLPLCSAGGVLYFPMLATWLAWAVISTWRSGEPDAKRNALVAGAGLTVAGLLSLFYFWGFDRAPASSYNAHTASLGAVLRSSIAVLTASFGSTGPQSIWPVSGYAALTLLVVSLAFLVGVLVFPRKPVDRARALGLLFFLGACGTLILGLGWGRASFGTEYGFIYRQLPVPVLCALFFAWGLNGPRVTGTVVQTGLCICLGCFAWFDIRAGFERASKDNLQLKSFERELREGVPPYILIARHEGSLLWGVGPNYEILAPAMESLRRAGIDPFRYLQQDPPFEEEPLEMKPADVVGTSWEDGKIKDSDANSFLTFKLPRPTYVAAIKMRYISSSSRVYDEWAWVGWTKSDEADFPDKPQGRHCSPDETFILAVADTIEQIRFYPRAVPGEIEITEFTILVPAMEGRGAAGQ